MRSHERRTTLIGALAALTLVAAACSSDGDAESDTTEAPQEESVTTDASDDDAAPEDDADDAMDDADDATDDDAMDEDDVATTEAPQEESVTTDAPADDGAIERVVSLSPTHTEIMFAIGAGDLVVAVDQFSNYPEAALDLPNELSGFEPDVEAIAAYEPDLVLIGGDFTGLGDQLDDLGIASWDGPAASSFDDTYAQIEQIGAATGHVAEAAELVLSMQTRIDELTEAAPQSEVPLTYFHELDPSLFSTTSSTFIGEVYSLFGLLNIADEFEEEAGQFPQVSAEFLVAANPDLVFLADTICCGETAATFGARDGYGDMAAVVNGNVIEMNDDIASRWGPRIVDYIEAVAVAVEAAAVTV